MDDMQGLALFGIPDEDPEQFMADNEVFDEDDLQSIEMFDVLAKQGSRFFWLKFKESS
ncbi:DUF3102 domain-containing protein [Desulfitobacterium sp. LBE]|uniref:DUF3102 domain-containing protein n=1 Tax=Desulfitobacterium sp. LBE TaxID=884086 RepID=UPI001FAA398D|nr:DUF3102 domain-containing protein [Desulfitobacterium sp. LBE]